MTAPNETAAMEVLAKVRKRDLYRDTDHLPKVPEDTAVAAMLTFSAEQNTGGMPGREELACAIFNAAPDRFMRLGQCYPIADAIRRLSLAGTGGTGAEAMREAAARGAYRAIEPKLSEYANSAPSEGNAIRGSAMLYAANLIAQYIRALPTTPTGDSSRG